MSVSFINDVIYHDVCQVNMSDLMMNIQTCATDNTIYIMLYFRSICQIHWWMYTHVLLITLLTSWCLSDQYVGFNDKCTHICYWIHYLHHVLCQITMPDLMMNVHTHVLLITLFISWYMSDQYVRCNYKCTNMCYE